MRTIELANIPNQKFSFSIENNQYEVTLQSRSGMTYLSYSMNNKAVLLNRICLDRVPIDDLFMFEDTQGTTNPYYVGFRDRFNLRLMKY